MGAVEAAVELLWENRVKGDELEASWELLEPYGPEAIKKAKELYKERVEAEASPKNSRVEPSIVEAKVKPKMIRWRQIPSGWEYLLEGETGYRRGFGAPPKHLLAGDKKAAPVVALKVVEQRKPEPGLRNRRRSFQRWR